MRVLIVDQIAKVNYKYTFSLANALKDKKINIDLVVDQKKEQENCRCNIIRLFNTDEKNIGKLEKLINYVRSYRVIGKTISDKNIEILHTQWLIFSPVDYFFLKKFKQRYGIKLIVTIHDILPFNKKFYDMNFHAKVYSLADRIIVQAENNMIRFRELFPNLIKKVTMIPHGNFFEYAEIVDKRKAREHLGIDNDKFVLLFFGQIKKVKGVGVLLNAFSKIFKKYPNMQLIIAGSVWKDDFFSYQEIIDKNNMSSSVRTDIRYIPDDDVKYYYSSADVCILPYLDVYQSGVIQLSYAYKKAVIATNIGAFREVVINEKTGFLCNVNDPDDLSCAIEKAYNERKNLKDMGCEGYNYISEKYSWDKIADKVYEEYFKCI